MEKDLTKELLEQAGEPTKKRGRPTLYKEEYAERAYTACLLGSTNEELATKVFDVTVSTIGEWIAKVPEFSDAVKRGRQVADEEVVKSLYRRAVGYEQQSVKIFLDKGKPVIVPFTERFPPSEAAMFWWLKNRQKDKWKERTDIELAASEINVTIGGKPVRKT